MSPYVGTSGFSYPAWKGAFYPEGLPAARMLEHYASRLPSVELNNTFYRMPNEATLDGWVEKVSPAFRFVLKAPRQITHSRRLKDCAEPLARFTQLAARLGPQLGALLFQLPPNFRCDPLRLQDCLRGLPADLPVGFEFRHPSWSEHSEVAEMLRAQGCCQVVVDSEEQPLAETPADMPFQYVRLRASEYSAERLQQLAALLKQATEQKCFIFFKHETQAPTWALSLLDLLGGAAMHSQDSAS